MSRSSRRKARAKRRTRSAAKVVTAPQVGRPPARTATAPAPPAKKLAKVVAAPAAAAGPTTADRLHRLCSRTGLLRVAAIARRDLAALFVSPVGWVVAALFTFIVSGFGFIATVLAGQQATMGGVFSVITNFLIVVLVPLLTMRVFAEERAQGTLELLLTSPVRDWELTAGKWAGAFAFYVILLAITAVYVVILRVYVSGLDLGLIDASYLGLLLVGAAAVAMGVFASSLTSNQVIAFFIAMAMLLVVWYAGYVIGIMVSPPANLFFDYVGGWNRFQAFSLGEVALRDVVYFLTLTVAALLLTTRVLASRRWR